MAAFAAKGTALASESEFKITVDNFQKVRGQLVTRMTKLYGKIGTVFATNVKYVVPPVHPRDWKPEEVEDKEEDEDEEGETNVKLKETDLRALRVAAEQNRMKRVCADNEDRVKMYSAKMELCVEEV